MKLRIPYWYLLLGPALLFALGFLMNSLVIAANGGSMPVLWPGGCSVLKEMQAAYKAFGGDDSIHSCMVHASRYKFLADWIPLPGAVASPGDFLMWAYDYSVLPAFVAWVVLIVKDHNGRDRSY